MKRERNERQRVEERKHKTPTEYDTREERKEEKEIHEGGRRKDIGKERRKSTRKKGRTRTTG